MLIMLISVRIKCVTKNSRQSAPLNNKAWLISDVTPMQRSIFRTNLTSKRPTTLGSNFIMPLKQLSHEEKSNLFIQGRICKRQTKLTVRDRGEGIQLSEYDLWISVTQSWWGEACPWPTTIAWRRRRWSPGPRSPPPGWWSPDCRGGVSPGGWRCVTRGRWQ